MAQASLRGFPLRVQEGYCKGFGIWGSGIRFRGAGRVKVDGAQAIQVRRGKEEQKNVTETQNPI